MLSPNKSCSKDNLNGVIDVQQYNPLIHQRLRKSHIQAVIHINLYASTEGAIEANPQSRLTRNLESFVRVYYNPNKIDDQIFCHEEILLDVDVDDKQAILMNNIILKKNS